MTTAIQDLIQNWSQIAEQMKTSIQAKDETQLNLIMNKHRQVFQNLLSYLRNHNWKLPLDEQEKLLQVLDQWQNTVLPALNEWTQELQKACDHYQELEAQKEKIKQIYQPSNPKISGQHLHIHQA